MPLKKYADYLHNIALHSIWYQYIQSPQNIKLKVGKEIKAIQKRQQMFQVSGMKEL